MSMAAIGSAVAGGVVGGLMGGGGDSPDMVMPTPTWSPYQLPYVWEGDPAQMGRPQMNAQSANYFQSLSAGANPMFGPQMGGMPGLGGMFGLGGAGSGGGMPGYPQDPWFMNNQGSVYEQGVPGGVAGLLGFGQGAAPPLMTNNPLYSGEGVRDPENLKGGKGTIADPNRGTGGTPPEAGAPAGMTGSIYVSLPDGSVGVQLANGSILQPEEAAAMARAGLLGDIGMPKDQRTQALVRRFQTPGTGLERVMQPSGGGVLDFYAQQKQMDKPDWGTYSAG